MPQIKLKMSFRSSKNVAEIFSLIFARTEEFLTKYLKSTAKSIKQKNTSNLNKNLQQKRRGKTDFYGRSVQQNDANVNVNGRKC